jgi:hypothetical protein
MVTDNCPSAWCVYSCFWRHENCLLGASRSVPVYISTRRNVENKYSKGF